MICAMASRIGISLFTLTALIFYAEDRSGIRELAGPQADIYVGGNWRWQDCGLPCARLVDDSCRGPGGCVGFYEVCKGQFPGIKCHVAVDDPNGPNPGAVPNQCAAPCFSELSYACF
jgi:hypothetical protein